MKKLAEISRPVPRFIKNREGSLTLKRSLAGVHAEVEQPCVCKGIPNIFSPFRVAKETELFTEAELIQFMFASIN